MDFLFPKTSNKRKGEVSIEDFAPIVKKEIVKPDLYFNNGQFYFRKGWVGERTENTGFTAVLSPDMTQAFILKSTTPETKEHTMFVKTQTGVLNFTSDSLEFTLQTVGISVEKGLYLYPQKSVNGWEVFSISETIIEPQAEVEQFAQIGVEEFNHVDEPLEDLV